MKHYMAAHDCLVKFTHSINISLGPSNRSNSVSSLDLEGESVSELGAGPSGSNGVEALQLLEHEQGKVRSNSVAQVAKNLPGHRISNLFSCELAVFS